MPEGDTIFRAAHTLDRALAGKLVVRFESVLPALTRVDDDTPFAGRTIERVRAAGKHLLMEFSGGHVLRTHMRMNGSWHIYRPGERWQRPQQHMRVLVATADFVAVGFDIPVAEIVPVRELPRHRELKQLGPDLLAADFDADEVLRRVRTRDEREIGEAILDQRVMAGAGNVYKSEVLFLSAINPFALVSAVDDEGLRRVIATARTLLQANVTGRLAPMTTYTGYRRTTRRDDPSARLWVYGRARRPCRKCGAAVRVGKQGTDARLTYWCPACQPG